MDSAHGISPHKTVLTLIGLDSATNAEIIQHEGKANLIRLRVKFEVHPVPKGTVTSMLHTLHDGSHVKLIGARELIAIPVWNGNRTIDHNHVETIKASLHDIKALDFGFRIVTCMVEDAGGNKIKESKIIDGQHRHKVLTDHFQDNFCAEDFPVLVLEKAVTTEAEIITYFRRLNTQLPIAWKSDPVMVANEYIKALECKFNRKERLIRPGATKRPYISTDKIREKFLEVFKKGIASESPDDIKGFIQKVEAWNEKQTKASEFILLQDRKDKDIIQKAADKGFMLAVDPKMPWIDCLN